MSPLGILVLLVTTWVMMTCGQMQYSRQIKLGLDLGRGNRTGRIERAARGGQFWFHVHEDTSVRDLAPVTSKKVLSALNEALIYWSQALRPKQRVNRILLDRLCDGPGIWSGEGCPEQYGCSSITKCGEVAVPEIHLSACKLCGEEGCRTTGLSGAGVKGVDKIIYVSAVESKICQESQTLSHSSHCQQEASLDRPVAGHVNLCLNNIDFSPDGQVNLVDYIKHELLHSLGFSVQLYAFFRTGRGKPRTPRSSSGKPPLHGKYYLYVADKGTVKRVERENWQVANGNITKKIHMLVTPRVRREVRRHFTCNSLEGGELEDQGDLGTSLTHWEKRVFGDEAMTGNHQEVTLGGGMWREPAPVSRITLAVLEDSGWYRVNYRMADEFNWGKGAGCSYAKNSCLQFMREGRRSPRTTEGRGSSIAPFCDQRNQLKVTSSRRERQASGGNRDCKKQVTSLFCNLIRYSSALRPEHRNLDYLQEAEKNGDLANWGAGMWLADFCPTTVEMYTLDC